jgi:predicted nucleotidyltransferase
METAERQFETAEAALVDALRLVAKGLDAADVDAVLIGGLAVATLGRPRWTHDIDMMVRPEHAIRALDALAMVGMDTEQTDLAWLFKAFHGDVLVDLIFRSHGDMYLDDEMLGRSSMRRFKGVDVRVVSPEDLLVIKALVHDEHNPRHWHDALALITRCDLDWEYVQWRARHGRRRVLSLLLYAQSNDLPVPRSAIESLWQSLSES